MGRPTGCWDASWCSPLTLPVLAGTLTIPCAVSKGQYNGRGRRRVIFDVAVQPTGQGAGVVEVSGAGEPLEFAGRVGVVGAHTLQTAPPQGRVLRHPRPSW
eukprot:117689-Chlamydomonas_euryale.AAC.1